MGVMVLSRELGGEVIWVSQEVVSSSEDTTLPTRYGVSSTAASGCHCTATHTCVSSEPFHS